MDFTLTADPQFSLAAAAAFADGFPGTGTEPVADALSYAWPVDGDWNTARVVLRQDGTRIHGEIDGAASQQFTMRVRRDVERILSLDVDGAGFVELGRRDPVVAQLQARFPGLRPVLFYTPYEAAAWCIIGQRIRMTQAATIKQRLADDLGQHGAFPAPDLLTGLTSPQPGLTDRKIQQLRALAEAARDGALDRDHLRELTYDEANEELQRLPGIGPFSAELILIRGVGAPDGFPYLEQRLERAIRDTYHLSEDADVAFVADQWRPYRSWVGLLLRAAAQST